MSQPVKSSSAETPKIELWMDNWAWAVSEPDEVGEVGESGHPDDSLQTPPGLYKLGRMIVDLRAECEQLRGSLSEMKIRLTLLEGQIKTLQDQPKTDAVRSERRNGW